MSAAVQEDTEAKVERVSSSKGSRKAVSQAFVKLIGITTSPKREVTPEELAASPYPAYQPLLSDVTVQQKRPYWRDRAWTDTDVARLLFYVAMTGTALVLGPLTYSPESLRLMLVWYALSGGLGISLSYHRQLSHKSFRCPKPLEYFFAYMGALAFEGDPIEWAKGHSWHHANSDTPADRHSPRDGLWHSHWGWVLDESYADSRRDVKGNSKDDLAAPWFYSESPEFYGWLRETYMQHMLAQAVLFAVLGGLPGFVWGFVIRVLFTQNMTWLVNSAVHVWGHQPWKTGDSSKNNALVALLVFGDGWHANHHAFPASAAHGLEPWQVDPSYAFVCLLERLGLAWDVRRPTQEQMDRLRL